MSAKKQESVITPKSCFAAFFIIVNLALEALTANHGSGGIQRPGEITKGKGAKS